MWDSTKQANCDGFSFVVVDWLRSLRAKNTNTFWVSVRYWNELMKMKVIVFSSFWWVWSSSSSLALDHVYRIIGLFVSPGILPMMKWTWLPWMLSNMYAEESGAKIHLNMFYHTAWRMIIAQAMKEGRDVDVYQDKARAKFRPNMKSISEEWVLFRRGYYFSGVEWKSKGKERECQLENLMSVRFVETDDDLP
mgnify:CR=1 FL=1